MHRAPRGNLIFDIRSEVYKSLTAAVESSPPLARLFLRLRRAAEAVTGKSMNLTEQVMCSERWEAAKSADHAIGDEAKHDEFADGVFYC